ncbi:MAG TPA: YiiX/YebB-like N1pC/P60 family cysteine hydrolase [Marinilabiliaceae bacterium]|nr:YiiX/YebB-like N1pC/P60 family cysteine hydrolase [Marinilabiliaceae bacterium]
MHKISSFFITLTMAITLLSCGSENREISFQTGDLLFTGSDPTEEGLLSDAINEVTQTSLKTNYTHMGLVVVEDGEVEVIHAAPKKGVCREPLANFLEKMTIVDLYRFKSELNVPFDRAIERSIPLIGLPYDSLYIMNDENGYYCSSLIYTLFEDQNIFQLEPMTFKDPLTGMFHPSWEAHYIRLNVPIPEGQPGCNPNGMAESEALKYVGSLNLETLELMVPKLKNHTLFRTER